MGYLFAIILTALAVFLILLVLVQRGRGGGLTGALGGVGGSSAFGAKAGDVFTKITIVAASIWIVVCLGAAYWAGHRGDALGDGNAQVAPNADFEQSDSEEIGVDLDDTAMPDADDGGASGEGTESVSSENPADR